QAGVGQPRHRRVAVVSEAVEVVADDDDLVAGTDGDPSDRVVLVAVACANDVGEVDERLPAAAEAAVQRSTGGVACHREVVAVAGAVVAEDGSGEDDATLGVDGGSLRSPTQVRTDHLPARPVRKVQVAGGAGARRNVPERGTANGRRNGASATAIGRAGR